MRPQSGTLLCSLEAVPPGTAKGVSLSLNPSNPDAQFEIVVWHHPNGVRAFKNSCPHLGMPLETFPDRFLTADHKALVCSTHGAKFDGSGLCFFGPCKNQSLLSLPVQIKDGNIVLA